MTISREPLPHKLMCTKPLQLMDREVLFDRFLNANNIHLFFSNES